MVHLRVIQPSFSNEEATNVSLLFDPNHHDFRWNKDYTAFEPLPIRWTDNESYAQYQGDDEPEYPITLDDGKTP